MNNYQVPEGYKQTHFGVWLPQNWRLGGGSAGRSRSQLNRWRRQIAGEIFLSSISAKPSHLFGFAGWGRVEPNFLSTKCEKHSYQVRFTECGRVVAGVKSGLAQGGSGK
jgi:hypothetical protein